MQTTTKTYVNIGIGDMDTTIFTTSNQITPETLLLHVETRQTDAERFYSNCTNVLTR